MAVQSSPFCRLPIEVLENVVVEVILDHHLGQPAALLPILLTCRRFNNALTLDNNSHLYSRLFRHMFDFGAAVRRFGPKVINAHAMADQFRLYCVALQEVREGDIYENVIEPVFWRVFCMLTENDGKNRAQLEAVGLDSFVERYVRILLTEGRSSTRGWPVDDPNNSLALWIMAMTMTPEKLRAEEPFRREELIRHILPYVLVGCRYPATYTPPNHFILPDQSCDNHSPRSKQTAHGDYPIYRDPKETVYTTMLWGMPCQLSVPLISTAAKILYFAHRQMSDFEIPYNLPRDRRHAMSLGYWNVGPTQADMVELNLYKPTIFPCRTRFHWWEYFTPEQLRLVDQGYPLMTASMMYDHDWERIMYRADSQQSSPNKGAVYKSGSLNGLWVGRMTVPSEEDYMALVETYDYPPDFSERTPFVSCVPLYMRLREHHSVSPQTPMPVGGQGDGFDDGLFNAYFPRSGIMEADGTVEIFSESRDVYNYETYVPGRPNSHNEQTCTMCSKRRSRDDRRSRLNSEQLTRSSSEKFEGESAPGPEDGGGSTSEDESDDAREKFPESSCKGIQDIIITGATDHRHGEAWSHYSYFGRIRPCDGLIVILREPSRRDCPWGRWVFTGYLTGGDNIVGNWRQTGADVGVPTWEGAFIMSKKDG